jgi:hypothetical protein
LQDCVALILKKETLMLEIRKSTERANQDRAWLSTKCTGAHDSTLEADRLLAADRGWHNFELAS